jgi:hypothetical protein
VELAANQVMVSSTPTNADIELDGNFVGSTPSKIDVAPGDHVLVIKKAGYTEWQRKMKITGGNGECNRRVREKLIRERYRSTVAY